MGQERTEAIVIRGVDFSETSRIVTFLTPDRGKMACMATGVRRPKSALVGLLDTFNRLELVYYWKDGRSVQKLAEASLLHSFAGLKSNLEKGVYAAFPLEFAHKVAQENEPSHDLYGVLVRGLSHIETAPGAPRTQVAWLLLQLLTVSGYEPDLSSTGAFDEESAGRIGAQALRTLQTLAATTRECPIESDEPEAFEALRRYVIRHIESEFRSLRVIGQMFGR